MPPFSYFHSGFGKHINIYVETPGCCNSLTAVFGECLEGHVFIQIKKEINQWPFCVFCLSLCVRDLLPGCRAANDHCIWEWSQPVRHSWGLRRRQVGVMQPSHFVCSSLIHVLLWSAADFWLHLSSSKWFKQTKMHFQPEEYTSIHKKNSWSVDCLHPQRKK